jgi:hypothetical protein
MSPGERSFAVVVGVGMLAAVVSPLVRQPVKDGFPLSNYPMFSVRVATENIRIPHVVAFDAGGGGRPVPPDLLGTSEVMQAYQTVNIAVNKGAAASAALCRETAARVRDADGQWSAVVRLEVRLDWYDAIAYFEGQTRPHGSSTLARCTLEDTP